MTKLLLMLILKLTLADGSQVEFIQDFESRFPYTESDKDD